MQHDKIANSKQIAKNTVFLYLRSIIIMCVSIYTSRIILKALGINDFGIYNIVGGFVSMFSILSSSLVNASQRFISYEMGKRNSRTREMFSTILTTHILLSLLMLIILELFGLWFLNNKINISPDRLYAANWVFHLSVITFCFGLLNIPYTATIIAHERMSAFAYISIIEVFAKLLIVYAILLFQTDKLITYSVLMTSVAVILHFVYLFFCRIHFAECRHIFSFDKRFLESLLVFSGWNFFGSTASILSTQGINLLVNLFFGVALNAARGIAEQVNTAVNSFVKNFMTAINPQITKCYAAGDYDYMNELMVRGAKYGASMYWLISLTIFIEADQILKIWLVEVPPFSAVFLRLVIIYSIFETLSNTLYIGMLATGKIKKYQIIMGTLSSMSFVLCYIFFKIGFGPEWSYISLIIIVLACVFVRLALLEEIIPNFSRKFFFFKAIIKSLIVIVFSTVITAAIKKIVNIDGLLGLLMTLFTALISVPTISYFFALDAEEKLFIKSRCARLFKKSYDNI